MNTHAQQYNRVPQITGFLPGPTVQQISPKRQGFGRFHDAEIGYTGSPTRGQKYHKPLVLGEVDQYDQKGRLTQRPQTSRSPIRISFSSPSYQQALERVYRQNAQTATSCTTVSPRRTVQSALSPKRNIARYQEKTQVYLQEMQRVRSANSMYAMRTKFVNDAQTLSPTRGRQEWKTIQKEITH